MPVTPTGPVSVAVAALKTLISNVPFFQTWTGQASAGQALSFIYIGEDGFPVESISIKSGVATVQTRDVHTLVDDVTVTLEGASIGPESACNVAGEWGIVAAASNAFTFNTVLADTPIFYPAQAFVLPATRPLAFIVFDDDSLRTKSIGTGGAIVGSGSLVIMLEADTNSSYVNDPVNALQDAADNFSNFVLGLMQTANTGNFMYLNAQEPVSGPDFISKPEQNDNVTRFERWRACVKVSWGLEG